MTTPVDTTLARTLARHGQDHVLRFWGRLDEAGRKRLSRQLGRFDLALVDRLVAEHVAQEEAPAADARIQPAPVIGLPRTEADQQAAREARAAGEARIAAGQVAVLTVAGGQGSRLGFDGPKGAFPIGPVSGMTLFELFSRTVAAVRKRYQAPLPWLIMTSEANHAETEAFFAEHDFFGLASDSVRFFTQAMIPSVDFQGRMLLAAPDRVAVNPNGHGGTLLALRESGVLEELRTTGVELIHYFQVDNPLVAIADPVFLGYHELRGAEMSSKAVEKTGPEEKVGVFARVNNRPAVIEYSDLSDDLAQARNPDGSLTYGAGSIAIHVFSRSFVERITEGGLRLPYHKARKKVPHLDEQGTLITPETPNAIKFETFIFDALGLTDHDVTLMVRREDEFSPVKNASGVDSAESAHRHLVDRAWRWLEEAGVAPPAGGDRPVVEIDPGFALDPDELRQKAPGRLPGRNPG